RVWAKDLVGVSLESPQATYVVGPNGTGLPTGYSVNFNNPGGSQFFSGNPYSTDVAPDLIVKATFDPGYGQLARILSRLGTKVAEGGAEPMHRQLAAPPSGAPRRSSCRPTSA